MQDCLPCTKYKYAATHKPGAAESTQDWQLFATSCVAAASKCKPAAADRKRIAR